MRQKSQLAVALLLLFCTGVCAADATEDFQAPAIYGHWKITRLIPTTNVQTGADNLKPWIGKKISYSDSVATFGDVVVKSPKYKVRRLSEDSFYSDNRISPREIGIRSESVTEIDLTDESGMTILSPGPGTTVFARSKDKLVTMWDGGYFEMERLK
jgi:hypothetical protein